MLIRGNTAIGFEDAGIYIGGIVNTGSGSIVARGNRLYQNNRGIIVEDSFGASLQVESNVARHNHDDGIFLHNSDGIEVLGNLTTNNGLNGIELDPDSDHNLVAKNSSRDNASFDLANDGGTGNCFSNNQYETSTGSITC